MRHVHDHLLTCRLEPHAAVCHENYAFRSGGLMSAGVRLLGERMSVDFGLVSPLNADSFIAFPLVNFVWMF